MLNLKTSVLPRLSGLAFGLALAAAGTSCFGQASIDLQIMDEESGAPVAARVTFTKSAKRVPRPKRLLFAGDQWLVENTVQLAPATGEFEFLASRGPEFNEIRGGFTIEPKAKDIVEVEIKKTIDMQAEHWYSGDHGSYLPPVTLKRWQLADAVDMVVGLSHPKAQEQEAKKAPAPPASPNRKPKHKQDEGDSEEPSERELGLKLFTSSLLMQWDHGAVAFHRANDLTSQAEGELDKAKETFQLLEEAKAGTQIHPELMVPWTRDVPILLATEGLRSVQLLSSYNRPGADDRIRMLHDKSSNAIEWSVGLTEGKQTKPSRIACPMDPDDELRFKGGRGVGLLSEILYWKMLDAGLRLSPATASGFNNNDTRVGYNRTYIFAEQQPDEARWWQAIDMGRTMITNGPLLRVSINGLPPGSVQGSYRGQSIPLDIAASLAVRENVDYLDVIFNGETIYSAKLEDHYRQGEFPPLEIDRSGWLVVRVITAHDKGYRYASTAPFHFEFDAERHVSRKAVEYFQTWLETSINEIEGSKDAEAMRPWLDKAREFWNKRLTKANAP